MKGIGQLDRSEFRNFRGNFSSLGIFHGRYQQMKVDGFLDDLTSYLLSNLAKIFIHFQLANIKSFQDLEKFLRWFCAHVGLGLQLGNQIAEYWDELFGSQVSCKMYFEQYLLLSRTKLLVLV